MEGERPGSSKPMALNTWNVHILGINKCTIFRSLSMIVQITPLKWSLHDIMYVGDAWEKCCNWLTLLQEPQRERGKLDTVELVSNWSPPLLDHDREY